MIQKVREVLSPRFILEFALNLAFGLLIYKMVSSYFMPAPEKDISDFGPAYVQQQMTKDLAPQQSPIYIQTDTMNVVVDKMGGRIIKVQVRDYQDGSESYSTMPLTNQRQMVANMSVDGQNIAYKSSKSSYELKDKDTLVVKLVGQKAGLTYRKNLVFKRGEYQVGVEASVENTSNEVIEVSPRFDVGVGLRSKDLVPAKNVSVHETTQSSMPMARLYEGFSSSSAKKSYTRTPYAKIELSEPTVVKGGWIAFQDGYFVSSWVMPQDLTTQIAQGFTQSKDSKGYVQRYASVAQSSAKSVAPGDKYEVKSTFYSGPADPILLAPLAAGLKLTVDYGFFWMISSLLARALSTIHLSGLGWGGSLVVLIVLLRLVFYKFAKDQIYYNQAMAKAKPELDAIEAQFSEQSRFDMKRSEATLAVYKKHGVNPASACLMPLLNLPIYFATYNMVLASVHMKSQSFLWINDLAAADPYYLMPLLAGAGLYLQSSTSAQSMDPMMRNLLMVMPLVFVFAMLNAPACAALYVALQMWVQVIQTKLISTK